MHDQSLLVEDLLLLASAESPALSLALRSRAVTAAVEAHDKRSFSRRVVRLGAILVLAVGFAAWRTPLTTFGLEYLQPSLVAAADAAYDPLPTGVNVSLRYGDGRRLRARGDDWKLVEAEAESLKAGLRCLHMADEK